MTTVSTTSSPSLRSWRIYVRELWARREFAWFLATGNLRARNASTTLGLVWWVLDPVILSGIYFLVFGVIFGGRDDEPQFIAYLLSGMFAFHYTRNSATGAANSIIQNSKLLTNIRFPRLLLPISGQVEASVGFLTSLGVYYFIAWPVNGVRPTGMLWVLLPAIVIQSVFNLGLGAIVARLAVPLRDINNLIPHLMRLWLYLTPIIWPVALLDRQSEIFGFVVRLNPMYWVVAMYRSALMGRPLNTAAIAVSAGAAVVLGVVGVISFVRNEGNMVRYL